MKSIKLLAACATIALGLPAAAGAQTFKLDYTTLAGPFGPAVVTSATIVAIRDPFTGAGFAFPQAYVPVSIIGKRGTASFSNTDPNAFLDNFSEFYYPATAGSITGLGGAPTYLDGAFATLTYSINGVDYTLSRTNAAFYSEFSAGVSRDIAPSSFSIALVTAVSPVPEPATWAMMIAGFAAAGVALRRRRLETPASA